VDSEQWSSSHDNAEMIRDAPHESVSSPLIGNDDREAEPPRSGRGSTAFVRRTSIVPLSNRPNDIGGGLARLSSALGSLFVLFDRSADPFQILNSRYGNGSTVHVQSRSAVVDYCSDESRRQSSTTSRLTRS